MSLRVLVAGYCALFFVMLTASSEMRAPEPSNLLRAQPAERSAAYLPLVGRSAELTGGPREPEPWIPDAEFVIGGPTWTVDVVGDIAFVGVGAHIVAYDISGTEEMPLLGASPPLPGNARDVVVRDGFAFVAVHQMTELAEAPGGLFVLDVMDPAAMEVVAVREIRGGVTDIDLFGDRVLAARLSEFYSRERSPLMLIFDASDPRRPELIAESPAGDFGSEGEALLYGGIVLTCFDELRAFQPSGVIDSWIWGLGLAPCAALDRMETDYLIAAVSDSNDPSGSDPMVRIIDFGDLAAVETIGEIALEAFVGADAEVVVNQATIVGTDLFVAALVDGTESAILQFDVSDPTLPRAVASWSGEGAMAMLAVDANDQRVVAGAATMAGRAAIDPWRFDPEYRGVLASRTVLLDRHEDGWLDRITAVEGPGTLLSTVECHGDTAFVFEFSPARSGVGRLWALSVSDLTPEVMAVMDIPLAEQILREGAGGAVATEAGLYVVLGGRIARYSVVEDRIGITGGVEDDGTLAVIGDRLFVSDHRDLREYRAPATGPWSLTAAHELPPPGTRSFGVYSMISSADRLWMATSIDGGDAIVVMVVDVSDPSEFRIGDGYEMPASSSGEDLAWLADGGEAVWMLTSDPEGGFWVPPALSTFRHSPEGPGVEIEGQWMADPADELSAFPFSLAVLDQSAWFVSPGFLHGEGVLHSVQRNESGDLRLAGVRAAPAAVRSRSTDHYDYRSDTYGALSVAACGDRIFGTDIEGGLYGIDPERWLAGVDGR